MSDKTRIEWADATWNPVIGCTKVSPGCDNCYAIGSTARVAGTAEAYEGLTAGGEWTNIVRCLPDRLDKPRRWRDPRRIFVNSLSDLFHHDVPHEFIREVLAVMASVNRHTYQVLTKRAGSMRAALLRLPPDVYCDALGDWVHTDLSHVWFGVSIETDGFARRADTLRATPATTKFLSLEPLLGPLPSLDLTGIDWVIVGGETGPRARPMHPAWARLIRDRCRDHGIPFFLKQRGEWVEDDGTMRGPKAVVPAGLPGEPDAVMRRVGRRAAGRALDGRGHDEYPAAALDKPGTSIGAATTTTKERQLTIYG